MKPLYKYIYYTSSYEDASLNRTPFPTPSTVPTLVCISTSEKSYSVPIDVQIREVPPNIHIVHPIKGSQCVCGVHPIKGSQCVCGSPSLAHLVSVCALSHPPTGQRAPCPKQRWSWPVAPRQPRVGGAWRGAWLISSLRPSDRRGLGVVLHLYPAPSVANKAKQLHTYL